MAQSKSNTPSGPQTAQAEGELVRNEDAVQGNEQVKPTADRPQDELKADLTAPRDEKLGVLKEPEHDQDKTSVPTPYAPADRPPWATTRFDEPVVQSAVTGAGAHTPPDPDVYDSDGRIRDGK